MCICESIFNLTIGILLIKFNDFAHIKNNRVGGFAGRHLQKLFNSRRNKPFNCLLIGELEIGEKLPNGSFTGAIRQIQNKEMDLCFRQAPPFIEENDFMELTPVTNSENHLIGQILNDKSNIKESDLFFKFFDFKFTIYVFITLLSFFLIAIMAIIISKQDILSSLNSILKLNKNQKFFLLILSISFTIFSFNAMQIFLINIKTEKVIVDTSELLLTNERIFSSNLKLGWIKGEPDKDLIASSPNGTFLNKLYKYKNSNPPEMMDKSIDSLKDVEKIKNLFLFYNQLAIRTMAYVFNVIFHLKLFVNENPFYSTPKYLYRIKGKNSKTQFIDKSITDYFQYGFFEKFDMDFDSLKLIRNKDNVRIYYSAEEFIEDHTLFEAIKFDNLYYLFLIELIVIISIIIVSIIHYTKQQSSRERDSRKRSTIALKLDKDIIYTIFSMIPIIGIQFAKKKFTLVQEL